MLLERKLLILTTAALAGLGLLMVYSSSVTARPSFWDQHYLTRQFVFMTAGALASVVAARLPTEFWRRAAFPLCLASAALLVAVLAPGIGSRVNGANRWFRLGPVSLQPSELAKFAQILFLARAVEWQGDAVRRFWSGWLPLVLPSVLLGGLVLVEPDFGTATFLLAMALVMLFLAGIPYGHLLLAAGAAVPAAGWLVLAQPYRVKRLLEFMAGWVDPLDAPYQVQQSLVAVGSGGLWGTGLGQGWQKLGFLPEANTDFIFAIIGEELGLAGTLLVLALWVVFLVCGLRLAHNATVDRFARLVSLGLVVQLVFQAVLNIGVVTASLPTKGISLPLISYGGSNLVMSLVSVGVVLGLTRQPGGEQSTEVGKPLANGPAD